MDESQIIKELYAADWVSIHRELLRYALRRVQIIEWRGSYGVGGEVGELAKGFSCEDLVQTLMRKTLNRDRKWDPDRGPLIPWLKLNLRSEIDALMKSDEHKHEQDEIDVDGEESTATVPSSTIDHLQDPVNILLDKVEEEEIAKKLAPLYEATDEVPELAEIIDAVIDGTELKPRFLAEKLGTTVEDINNRLKRLRRLALRDTKKR